MKVSSSESFFHYSSYFFVDFSYSRLHQWFQRFKDKTGNILLSKTSTEWGRKYYHIKIFLNLLKYLKGFSSCAKLLSSETSASYLINLNFSLQVTPRLSSFRFSYQYHFSRQYYFSLLFFLAYGIEEIQ